MHLNKENIRADNLSVGENLELFDHLHKGQFKTLVRSLVVGLPGLEGWS